MPWRKDKLEMFSLERTWDLGSSKKPQGENKMDQFEHSVLGQLEYKYCPKIELKEENEVSIVLSVN